ncbi:MAG: hypothetical protein L3J02_07855, partial [Henriciella sp.]|nr:hypothetical protein [Henriciella sp.]
MSRPIGANGAGSVEKTVPDRPPEEERQGSFASNDCNSVSPANNPRAEKSGKPHGKPGKSHRRRPSSNLSSDPRVYAALDLGTNNCRLLVANPNRHTGFRVIDAFSRIVRLGEGLTHSGNLSDEAEVRAIAALKICTDKMIRRGVERSRLIATEACRSAKNGKQFIARVKSETGLNIEIIDRKTEAQLAVAGCAALLCPQSQRARVFDIGGGSSEIMWLAPKG